MRVIGHEFIIPKGIDLYMVSHIKSIATQTHLIFRITKEIRFLTKKFEIYRIFQKPFAINGTFVRFKNNFKKHFL